MKGVEIKKKKSHSNDQGNDCSLTHSHTKKSLKNEMLHSSVNELHESRHFFVSTALKSSNRSVIQTLRAQTHLNPMLLDSNVASHQASWSAFHTLARALLQLDCFS